MTILPSFPSSLRQQHRYAFDRETFGAKNVVSRYVRLCLPETGIIKKSKRSLGLAVTYFALEGKKGKTSGVPFSRAIFWIFNVFSLQIVIENSWEIGVLVTSFLPTVALGDIGKFRQRANDGCQCYMDNLSEGTSIKG